MDILQVFPENEVRKGQLTMQLKRLRATQENLAWPEDNSHLPIINWESCQLYFLIDLQILFRNIVIQKF